MRYSARVEAMDGGRPRVGSRGRRAVERRFQPPHQIRHDGGVRPRAARRRHLAGPQLLVDLLQDGCVLGDARRAHGLERQARGPRPVVVASETVAAYGGSQQLGAGRRVLAPALRRGRRCQNRQEGRYQRRNRRNSSSAHWIRSVAFDSMRQTLSSGVVFAFGLVPALGAFVQVSAQDARPNPAPETVLIEAVPAQGSRRSNGARRRRGPTCSRRAPTVRHPWRGPLCATMPESSRRCCRRGPTRTLPTRNGETPLLFACGNGNLGICADAARRRCGRRHGPLEWRHAAAGRRPCRERSAGTAAGRARAPR